MANLQRWTLRLIAVLAASVLCGCLMIPVPAKTRTEGASGRAKLDIKAFRSGETTRAQVEQQLEAFRVPIESDKLLWARYSESGSAILWAAGGPGAATGGGVRNWGMHNLFVTFNDDGTLNVMRRASEGELHQCLREYIKSGALEPILTEETEDGLIEIDVVHRHRRGGNAEASVKMTLKPDAVLLEEYWSKKHSFQLKPGQILELRMAGALARDSKPFPGSVLESMRFRDEHGKEQRWSVYVHPADLPVLLRYFDTVVASSRTQTAAKSK